MGLASDKSQEFDALVDGVAKLGFCGSFPPGGEPSHLSNFLPSAGTVSAEDFVLWVLRAERMDQDQYPDHFRNLRNAFIRHIGSRYLDISEISGSVWVK